MSAIQQLEDALQDRNKQTNAFLEEIISIINESVESLPFCTRANSTPEVAGSVKVLKKDLDGIIAKIKDDGNIDEDAAKGLVTRLKLSNLRKSPRTEDQARFSDNSPRSSYASARGSSGLIPRLSELDDLRFSADRTSFASADGSPRSSVTNRAYPIVEPNATGEYVFDQPPRGGKRTRRR